MHTCSHDTVDLRSASSLSIGRRHFLKIASLGTGAVVFLSRAPAAHAVSKADALLLTCIDYRLADDIHKFMDSKGMTDNYDHVILAGASAGAISEAFAQWHDTFWSHLDVAIDLHGITKVIIMDHRDCGAYKIAYGAEHAADPATETALHTKVMGELAAAIRERKPDMEVEGYLMALDGTAEDIAL